MSPFVRFLITGGIAAAANIGSRAVLSLAMPFEVAVVIAYLIGMATAYVLARLFVFEASGRGVASEAWRFAAVNAVALAQVWLVGVLLVRWGIPSIGLTWNAELIAHTIAVMSPVFTSFVLHRSFTFRSAQ